MRKVLFLAAHTDDEITSAASLLKHIEAGDRVTYIAFSFCENTQLIKECLAAGKELGFHDMEILNFHRRIFPQQRQAILDKLIELREKISPDVVFCPSSADIHQDHNVLHQEAVRAFRDHTIFGYDMAWNNVSVTLNSHYEVTEAQVDKKIKALKNYSSQSLRSYFNEDFLKGLARVRGVQFRCQYAEAFEAIKIKT